MPPFVLPAFAVLALANEIQSLASGKTAVFQARFLAALFHPGFRTEFGTAGMDHGHFEGTFRNDFDGSAMGMGVLPATGKKIAWPDSDVLVSVRDGMITRLHDIDEEATTAAFFAALAGG